MMTKEEDIPEILKCLAEREVCNKVIAELAKQNVTIKFSEAAEEEMNMALQTVARRAVEPIKDLLIAELTAHRERKLDYARNMGILPKGDPVSGVQVAKAEDAEEPEDDS